MENRVVVYLTQIDGFEFIAKYSNGIADIRLDEIPPLGTGKGPNPVQLFATSIANCLSSSLLFALRKFKQDPTPLKAYAEAIPERNADGRLRISAVNVTITLGQPAASYAHLERALDQFERFSTVTASIRQSVPVSVRVLDSMGIVVK